MPLSSILYFTYGIFLMICGISAVLLIGKKAKTALASGGMAAVISCALAYVMQNENHFKTAAVSALIVSIALFCVFSWRSAKTLVKVFELIPQKAPELNGKGIAFLIIALMAVVSIVTSILQVLLLSRTS